MKKGIAILAQQDKRNIDGQKNNAYQQLSQSEVLSLILSRLQALEEKVDRIEDQTKNHWARSE